MREGLAGGYIPNSPVVYIMLCMSAICFMTLWGLRWPHGNTLNVVVEEYWPLILHKPRDTTVI